uniref:Uncharacterized protein n=1 Tax=Meloidogyne hapla TaxID=6305 RepID=A0A1I8B2Z4_MELHA
MVVETQSQQQQKQQSTPLINIPTPILTPESTLNLDQHPSAFNRVGRGINNNSTVIESSTENQQPLQCDNSSSSSSTNSSTPIGVQHPSTAPQGTTQQHRMLLELIQKVGKLN